MSEYVRNPIPECRLGQDDECPALSGAFVATHKWEHFCNMRKGAHGFPCICHLAPVLRALSFDTPDSTLDLIEAMLAGEKPVEFLLEVIRTLSFIVAEQLKEPGTLEDNAAIVQWLYSEQVWNRDKPCAECGGCGEKWHPTTADGHGQKFPCVPCHGTGSTND